jgi:hypothetical protein
MKVPPETGWNFESMQPDNNRHLWTPAVVCSTNVRRPRSPVAKQKAHHDRQDRTLKGTTFRKCWIGEYRKRPSANLGAANPLTRSKLLLEKGLTEIKPAIQVR